MSPAEQTVFMRPRVRGAATTLTPAIDGVSRTLATLPVSIGLPTSTAWGHGWHEEPASRARVSLFRREFSEPGKGRTLC
jgi:hypothetical protein